MAYYFSNRDKCVMAAVMKVGVQCLAGGVAEGLQLMLAVHAVYKEYNELDGWKDCASVTLYVFFVYSSFVNFTLYTRLAGLWCDTDIYFIL